jgi:PadR family transcriptional regulator, regulatory protein AphA
MDLRHALLGVLNEDRASAYQLARRFEGRPWRYAWHAQRSQIHTELYRMAADGLITLVGGGPRRQRVYSITRHGQAELRLWLLAPPATFVARSELVFRLLLLPTLDRAEARTLLVPIADRCAQELDALGADARSGDDRVQAGAEAPWSRLTTELARRSVEALYEWALWALAELDTPVTH